MSKKFMVLDTEAGGIVPRNNDVRPEEMRVYDLGFIVADRDGVVYQRESMVDITRLTQRDTYRGYNDRLVNSAYYAEKLPQYWAGIRSGEWEACSFYDMRQRVQDAIKQHNVKDIWAYNAKFDRAALNATIAEASNGFCRFFMPYKTQWRDIWGAASECITNTPKYVKWCNKHGYMSDKGNPTTSAEVVYRYLTDNHDFAERHTALSDCEIELAILLRCFKAHKKKPKSLGNGWRNASKVAKELREKGDL